MKDFDTLLKNSATAHGHLCPGQVVGVRMAMLGCWLIGLDVPTRIDQIKKLIVLSRWTAVPAMRWPTSPESSWAADS